MPKTITIKIMIVKTYHVELSHAEKKSRSKSDFSKARIKCLGRSLGIFNEVPKRVWKSVFSEESCYEKFPLNSH